MSDLELKQLELELEQLEIKRHIRLLIKCFVWSQFLIVLCSVIVLIIKGFNKGFV